MVRLRSFQFFYWLVVITFVSLLGLVTFIRPLARQQDLQEPLQTLDYFNESVNSRGGTSQNYSRFQSKFRIQNFGLRIWNVNCREQELRLKLWDIDWEFGNQNMEFGIQHLEFSVQDLVFSVQDLGFGIWNLGCGIWDLGFGI